MVSIKKSASTTTSRIISDTTLGVAAQTIGNAVLANLKEFDFELHVPDAATAVGVSAYINGDTTSANYRSQRMQGSVATIATTAFDAATMARIGTAGPTVIKGRVRLADSHFTLLSEDISHDSTVSDFIEHYGLYRELTDTDFTQISFDTDSGVNLFPIGTRLILLNPYG